MDQSSPWGGCLETPGVGGYRRLSSDHNVATDAPLTARSVWTSQSAEEHLGLRKQFR